MRSGLLLLMTVVIVASCGEKGANQMSPVGSNRTAIFKPPPDPFGWPIIGRTGKQVGIVTTRLENRGVAVTVDTLGLPPGLHGVHIHEIAKCEAPQFGSAGGHWDWSHKQHGRSKNPQGYNPGDLGNLTVTPDGKGRATFVVATNAWDPKLVGGLPLVIHAEADDERSDPSGNSGERIACGVMYLRRD